jgi:hypothetical protein
LVTIVTTIRVIPARRAVGNRDAVIDEVRCVISPRGVTLSRRSGVFIKNLDVCEYFYAIFARYPGFRRREKAG